jgi:hypothetical protein
MTTMLTRLEAEFRRVVTVFHAEPAVARMLQGEFSTQEYGSLMRSVSHHARENPQIQAAATVHFRGAQRKMVKAFYRHATAEIGHDDLARNDMAALGIDVTGLDAEFPPSGAVALNAFAYHVIEKVDPVAYLGYLFFLEYLPVTFGAEYQAVLDRVGIPTEARSFLSDHATFDVAHTKMMANYVEQLVVDEDRFAAVRWAMETTARLYANMVAEAFARPAYPADSWPSPYER